MTSLKLAGFIPRNSVHYNPHDIYYPTPGLDSVKPSVNEIPVGGIAYIGGKRYKVVEAERRANCYGCVFKIEGICQKGRNSKGNISCSAYSRSDQTWVIFKEMNKDGSIK